VLTERVGCVKQSAAVRRALLTIGVPVRPEAQPIGSRRAGTVGMADARAEVLHEAVPVFGGMLASTLFAIPFVPIFYLAARRVAERLGAQAPAARSRASEASTTPAP
jgi:hypothetical protein